MKELCKGANAILLQETNWKNEKMEDFKSRWNGDVFYNNGDESGRGSGVAILIKRDGCGQVKGIYDDGVGQSLAVEMNCGKQKMILYNIHAPGEEKKKKEL